MAMRKERYDETFGEHFQKLYEKNVRIHEKTLGNVAIKAMSSSVVFL
jgi:hypothetical protein